MKAKIVTDSISDITPDIAEQFDIEVLPVSLKTDDKYISPSDISVSEMLEWIEKNKAIPEFKGVSYDDYIHTFDKYLKQGSEIVCIASGGQVISNYDCALYASVQFPGANINVIDSNRFSGNVGLLSVNAAKMAQEGKSANEIAIICERSIDKIKQVGLVDSLDFLTYTGQVPKIVAAGTNLLNAKLAFSMSDINDRNAEIMGYSMESAVTNLSTKAFKNYHSLSPETVFITYTESDDNYVTELFKYLTSLNYFDDIVMCKSSHFNTSFVGKNSISITYKTK